MAAAATPATLDRFDREAARRLYDKLFGNVADFVFFFAGEMPGRRGAAARREIHRLAARGPEAEIREDGFQDRSRSGGIRRGRPGAVTPKSSIERIYHGRFDYTPENYAALRYVTYILGARYLTTVREEKGGTYYVGVHDEVSAVPAATVSWW